MFSVDFCNFEHKSSIHFVLQKKLAITKGKINENIYQNRQHTTR